MEARPLWRFLMAAGIFHILLTTAIYCVGRAQLSPDLFDAQGYGNFAFDSYFYLGKTKEIIAIIDNGGFAAWLWEPFTVFGHTKLLSISFMLLSPLFGFTILSAELYNLIGYLVILYLIYTLGSETFNKQSGLLAAIAVGLWPSFLLHTTQLLRDSLSIAGFLALVLISIRWLNRAHRPASALIHTVLSILLVKMLDVIRPAWLPVFISIVALSTVGLIIQMGVERRNKLWNLFGSALVLAASVVVLSSAITRINSQVGTPITQNNSLDIPQDDHSASLWDSALIRTDAASHIIGAIRQKFVLDYSSVSGSMIDTNYQIRDTEDLILYLPRAVTIGLFAPFPNMWLEMGNLGLSARLLSGVETFIMYGFNILAVLGLWYGRRRLSVWYLLVVIILGVTFLGAVVAVIGALYRMRYFLWMLLILLGAGGFQCVLRPLFHNFWLDKKQA